ncbi:MAG: 3,4-dihydroxy-2-butanone-4-phosphate synthase [Deltaproteobacteria bacterium]|nr:3,4-dihydroxy-2-butanone-4-phosphate synthase [Deltaproteobacteria bacterium]
MRSTVEAALEDIRQGRMIILTDNEDPDSEGDLVMAAEKVTPDAVNFMATYARGLVCLALTPERIERLKLRMMTGEERPAVGMAFTVSIEAAEGVTTGISAADRAITIQAAIADEAGPEDLVCPGHVFPLRARRGGVLVRIGQTEGSVDLARLAGLKPAGVLCTLLDDEGDMAQRPYLDKFAEEHGLKLITITQLVSYRLRKESLVHRAVETRLPTRQGEFRAIGYVNDVDKQQHLALIKGTITPDEPTLVRVHSECLLGDVFGSVRCACGDLLAASMRMVEAAGKGVILYIHREGREAKLIEKFDGYTRMDEAAGRAEVEPPELLQPDLRDYGIGAQILSDVGVGKMRLLTNSPVKIIGLEGYGLFVVEKVPLPLPVAKENREPQRRIMDINLAGAPNPPAAS